MTPELAIFDCDGVLVDSEPVSCRMLWQLLVENGMSIGEAETNRRFRGLSDTHCAEIVSAELGRPLPETFLAELKRRTLQSLAECVEAIPGVEVALDALDAAGMRACVASSGTHDQMRTTLGRTGLIARFEGVCYSAAEVANGKPAPDLFLLAARRMGAEASACVVIEDSLPGVAGARAANMRVLGYAGPGGGEADALAAAGAEVFDAMALLPGLLGVPVTSGRAARNAS